MSDTDVAQNETMILTSALTCPACGHQATETMPTDACLVSYACTACGILFRPKRGDCCVFCSYGTVPCPPMQAERQAGVGAAQEARG